MPSYTIVDLPPPPLSGPDVAWGVTSTVNAINEQGNSAGFVAEWPDPNVSPLVQIHTTVWDGTAPQIISEPAPYDESIPAAMNDSGEVVGALDTAGPGHAFLYEPGGQMQALPQFTESRAEDINNGDVVVGFVGDLGSMRPFAWNSAGGGPPVLFDPLPGHTTAYAMAVNELGHVAGISQAAVGAPGELFVIRDGQVEDLGPAESVGGINVNGVITGSRFVGASERAFSVDSSAATPVFEDLGVSVPGMIHSRGEAINDDGTIVGTVLTSQPDVDLWPFVYYPPSSPDHGWFKLQDLLVDGSNWDLQLVGGINNNGQIVGSGTHGSEYQGFRLGPPDPFASFPHMDEFLMEFVMLIGGVERGGGGIGITPSGRPRPIPPHEPFVRMWRHLTPAERDMAIASAIGRLGSQISDDRGREHIEQTTQEITRLSVREMNKRTQA